MKDGMYKVKYHLHFQQGVLRDPHSYDAVFVIVMEQAVSKFYFSYCLNNFVHYLVEKELN